MTVAEAPKAPQRLGRYAVFDAIAAGGMATVHLAQLAGQEGFSRVVAVKRLHPHLLLDPEFKRMFVAEARLAARVRHPNVVPILDVIAHNDELLIVMEYVHGESLIGLLRASKGERIPLAITCAIMVSVLQGLHAAHEACDESGNPLGIVHRDVSPHNVIVGSDGVARVLDFGIAKAVQARHDTNPGVLKGKCSYMAPEVLQGDPVTRQADVFAAATVFWELLTGKKLFHGATEQERIQSVLAGEYPTPRQVEPSIPVTVDRIVMKGLRADPATRYATALEMAVELEQAFVLASQRVVGQWVSELAAETLTARADLLREIESSGITTRPSFIDGLAPRTESDVPPTHHSLPVGAPSRSRRRAAVIAGVGIAAAIGVVLAVSGRRDAPPAPAATASAMAATPEPRASVPSTAPAGASSATPAPPAEPSRDTATPSEPSRSAPDSLTVPSTPKKRTHAKSYMPNNL